MTSVDLLFDGVLLRLENAPLMDFFRGSGVILAHCASSDFDECRRQTRGIARFFSASFGKPSVHDRISSRLCVQRRGAVLIVTLLTKEKFNGKPTKTGYREAVRQLAAYLAANHFKWLTIPAIGMSRDRIAPSFGARVIWEELISRGINVRLSVMGDLFYDLSKEFLNIHKSRNPSRIK